MTVATNPAVTEQQQPGKAGKRKSPRSGSDWIALVVAVLIGVFIAGTVAVCGVLLSMLNAFALGIGRVRARMSIVVLILLATMLPQEVLLYPLYFMFRAVDLYDNVWSVIITFTVVQSAFGTY